MLIEPRSRFFQQYDLSLRPAYNEGRAIKFFEEGPALDVISLLQGSIGKDHGKLELKSKDECKITNTLISADGRYAAILFRRSSPDASTPVFGHRKTGKLRKADKQDLEDLAVSAHLFVDMLHDERRPGIYRAIVEETPTLGRSYIQSVIHKVLRHAEYDYKDRNGATKTTFTICALEGYKSAKIENALKAGTVPFVELVRKAKLSGFDTEGFIPKEQKQKVLIRKEGSSPLEKIKALKDWALQHEWDEVRVQVRLPDQRSRLVTLGREDDAASVLFVRAEQVYVESDLDVCCENVEPQLMEEALKIFAKDWGMQTKV